MAGTFVESVLAGKDRAGITMRDLLNDPGARVCLAQALNVRYFVYGAIVQTGSFNVETHLIDAQKRQIRNDVAGIRVPAVRVLHVYIYAKTTEKLCRGNRLRAHAT